MRLRSAIGHTWAKAHRRGSEFIAEDAAGQHLRGLQERGAGTGQVIGGNHDLHTPEGAVRDVLARSHT